MRIAYVHVLPLELYPPAMNTLALLASQPGWEVRAWSSHNTRGSVDWTHHDVIVSRRTTERPDSNIIARSSGYARWHLAAAMELRAFKPEAIIAVEPHSTAAVWLYYSMFNGNAPLFIHHHEYYAPEDYYKAGNRLLRATRHIERDSLLERAVWVSQTNERRLEMFIETHPRLDAKKGRVLPNYPPAEWVARAALAKGEDDSGRTRLLYVGSASFQDTFIREIALWVQQRPNDYSLHVVGSNVSPDIWTWLESLGPVNITTDRAGLSYEELPALMTRFDVGLVLYKGNTLNFVYNVPNKTIEYLACGLEVWFPPEMDGMRDFKSKHSGLRTREVDFKSLSTFSPERIERADVGDFSFTNESASVPLLAALESIGKSAR
jgi:hypothetical protein